MGTTAAHPGLHQIHREKRMAAASSLLAALLMAALKLAAGLLTGSLALLSEAVHSGLDLIASCITLFSVEVSDRPADENHNYGHGKVESLSAFFETFLMLGSCVWIIWEAIRRIFVHHVALELNPWAFAVPVLAIVVDVLRSRSMLRVAHRHGSPALEADAIHFRTDIWSSHRRAGRFVHHPACLLAAGPADGGCAAGRDAQADATRPRPRVEPH